MSNILYISPLIGNDGWGSASREYLRALMTTGHNIKIKNFYTTLASEPRPEFKDLYTTKIDKFDYVIQKAMPNQFCYDREFGKNIGLFPVENWGWNNNWIQPIKMMDENWTTSEYSKKCILKTIPDLKTPVKALPIPCDISKFSKEYPKVPKNVIEGRFMFYFVGEDITRKNIDLVVKAFHLTFDRNENVGLLIKTNRVGYGSEFTLNGLSNRIEKIKNDLCLHSGKDKYTNEVIIVDRLSEDELNGLHQSCNCFIMPSSGEGWVIPAMDAAGFGNWVIMTETGCSDYAADILIESDIENVCSSYHPCKDLMTGHEKWLVPKLNSLMSSMRLVYNKHLSREKPRFKDVNLVSYETIGERICQML